MRMRSSMALTGIYMLDRDRFLDPTAPESTLFVAGTTPCVILRARGVSEHSENGHWTGDGHDRISLVGPTANQRCRRAVGAPLHVCQGNLISSDSQ